MKPYLALIAALGLAACMKDGATNTDAELQPGQIQLVQGVSAISGSGSSDSSSTYVFNLDTAKSSIEQEFILQNSGDYDVKNIKLITNNPHFYFSPSEIPLLPPTKKSLIVQVIKLKVIHGLRLDGIGIDSMLPMGLNSAKATITATTSNSHHDSLALSQSAQLRVFAKVMDVTASFYTNVGGIFDSTTDIDLFHGGSMFGTAVPNGTVSTYYAPGGYKIVNTGNVNLMVRNWNDGQTSVLDSAFLKPGESYEQTVPKGNATHHSLELDAQGVISNSAKFHRNSDGRIFILFYWY